MKTIFDSYLESRNIAPIPLPPVMDRLRIQFNEYYVPYIWNLDGLKFNWSDSVLVQVAHSRDNPIHWAIASQFRGVEARPTCDLWSPGYDPPSQNYDIAKLSYFRVMAVVFNFALSPSMITPNMLMEEELDVGRAASELLGEMSQYDWLVSVGIEGSDIYVYVTTLDPKQLRSLSGGYKGHRVIVKKISGSVYANSNFPPALDPATQSQTPPIGGARDPATLAGPQSIQEQKDIVPIIESKMSKGGRNFMCDKCLDEGRVLFGLKICPQCKGDPYSQRIPRPPVPGSSGGS